MTNSDSDYDPLMDKDDPPEFDATMPMGQQIPPMGHETGQEPGVGGGIDAFGGEGQPDNFESSSSGKIPNLPAINSSYLNTGLHNLPPGLPNGSASHINPLLPDPMANGADPGLGKKLETAGSVLTGGDTLEEGTMDMFRYVPQSMQETRKESLADSKLIQPHRLVPMFPFAPSVSEEGMGKDLTRGKEFNRHLMKKEQKQRHTINRRASESDGFKGITSSVEIREMCQIEAWKKMIHKNKTAFRSPRTNLEGTDTQTSETPHDAPDQEEPDAADQDRKAELEKKKVRDTEMSWAHNRFNNMPDGLVVDLRLFDTEDLKDRELDELKRSLAKLATYKTRVYPYQLFDYPCKISKATNSKDLFWSLDDPLDREMDVSEADPDSAEPDLMQENSQDELLDDLPPEDRVMDTEYLVPESEDLVEQDLLPGPTDELELPLPAPTEEPQEPKEPDEFEDELELELEKELDLDNESDELNNLENELESELLNNNALAITPTDEVSSDLRTLDEDQVFGELEDPETRLNLYDYHHKWHKFRTELDQNLTLSHFVEFEQNIKNSYNLNTQPVTPQAPGNEGILLKLYSVSSTNLKLLMHYNHPEVLNMVNSQIYDLNSSNILYNFQEEDATPKEDLLLAIDEPPASNASTVGKEGEKADKDPEKEREADKPKDKDKEKDKEKDKDDEMVLVGKESDIRRQWRKRLQTMSKETRLALVNMGKSLKYIENAFMNIESSRTYDSMVEYIEVSGLFKNCDYLNILNHSFDAHYGGLNPHDTGKEDEILNKRELIHTRVARNLVGILPLVGKRSKVLLARFHRLDFRTSLFPMSVSYFSTKKKKRPQDRKGELPGHDSEDEEGVGITWEVLPPLKSIINMNYKDDDLIDGMQNHCSNYFVNSSDLSLADDTKLVLLEYVERHPLLLNNLGMASRIDTYVNSGGENLFNNQDRKEEFLGTVVYNSEYDLFGVNHMLAPNDSQSILENTLFKAPIFYRATEPAASNPDPELPEAAGNEPDRDAAMDKNMKPEGAEDQVKQEGAPKEKAEKSATGKMYDFLLVRTSQQPTGSLATADSDVEVMRLRSFDDNVVLATVGQCEPKLTVNNPKSKGYLDDNKLLLKAWVLKMAMTSPVTDMKRLRKVARKKFYPAIPEKEISGVLKQVENTTIFSMRPQALEKMIQATIKPEVVCSLESTRAQKYRLKSRGVTRLKSHEGISTVSTILEQQETHFNNSIAQARDKLKQLKKAYYTRLITLNVDEAIIKDKISYFNLPLSEYTLYGHIPTYSSTDSKGSFESVEGQAAAAAKDPKTRNRGSVSLRVNYIEKLLKLANWNITSDVKMVLKGNGQFSLYGLGDPSNSGLAVSLIKRQVYSGVNTSLGNNIYNISIVGNSNEDLRKLSMEELSKRLQMYGVSPSIIKTLPRWDQVALVRQYRDGFGTAKNFDDPGNKFRIPPQEYQSQLTAIVQKQRQALTHPESTTPPGVNTQNSLNALKGLPSADSIDEMTLNDLEDQLSSELQGNQDKKAAAEDKEVFDDVDKELEELKLLKESFNLKKSLDLVIEDDKLIPIPGLMWLRQSRKTPSEPFGSERAVFVYGEKNIAKLLKWRRDCLLKNKNYVPTEATFGVNIGKRICRNCGQPGHIASNPKCPLYAGDKLKHDSAYLKQQARRMEVEAETSEDELVTSSNALLKDTRQYLRDNLASFKTVESDAELSDVPAYPGGIAGHYASDARTKGAHASSMAKRRKLGTVMGGRVSSAAGHDASDRAGSEAGGPAGEHDKKGAISSTDLKMINKILISIEKETRYRPFVSRIPETIAPNYYKIIKQPMWLSLLKLRVKTKYYLGVPDFVNDLFLIEINCKMYNSEKSQNAWLRQMSQVLVDDLIGRITHHITNKAQAQLIKELHINHINGYRNALAGAAAPAKAHPAAPAPQPLKLNPFEHPGQFEPGSFATMQPSSFAQAVKMESAGENAFSQFDTSNFSQFSMGDSQFSVTNSQFTPREGQFGLGESQFSIGESQFTVDNSQLSAANDDALKPEDGMLEFANMDTLEFSLKSEDANSNVDLTSNLDLSSNVEFGSNVDTDLNSNVDTGSNAGAGSAVEFGRGSDLGPGVDPARLR